MKKALLFILLISLSVPSLFAQNSHQQGYETQMQQVKKKLLDIIDRSPQLDDFVLCQELFEWDTIENQFKELGDGTITYEDKGAIKKFTIIAKTYEVGEESDIKLESYSSFQNIENFQNTFMGDSLLIFIGDGSGNYELFSKDINHYENEKLVLTEIYSDYSFLGLPGIIKSGETRYYYDNDGYLVTEASDDYSFISGMLEFSDSTIYENNNSGLPLVETGYQADFFTQQVQPFYQIEYSYVNQQFVETEIEKDYIQDQWIISGRNSFEYDNMDRLTVTLIESSTDNGASWENERKTQSIYDADLPLGFPSRDLTQTFVDGDWRNETFTTNTDCTSGLESPVSINVDMWFDQQMLNINHDLSGNGMISIFDMNGRKLYEAFHTSIPEQIFLANLERGIYVVQINHENTRVVKKVFK